jgi:hypothetical protein
MLNKHLKITISQLVLILTYRTEFPKNGFRILSEYNFTYAACDYCPVEYWPDNKTDNHTLIIFVAKQPLSDALTTLRKLVRDNVYV